MPKTVFIAHPMSGDIEGNTAKVVAILREVHSLGIIPIFPSFTTRQYLTDDPFDKRLAEAYIEEHFKRGFVDELWLYGDRITKGMMREVGLARLHHVLVVCKTLETKQLLSFDVSPGFLEKSLGE